MAALKGGVKDRIVHEIGRAIKQAQIEWCGVGCVRACTGRWLVLSLDAALLHGLHSLNRGYWPAVSILLDKPSLSMLNSLPYATKPIAKGRSWLCLCLSEGQLEGYLHALTSNKGLLESHYGPHALLRDTHRTHILLMLVAGLEHLKMAIPMDIPGWIQPGGSIGSSSSTSVTSMNVSTTSMDSSLPSPSQHEPFDVDLTCSEALEESWHSIEGEFPVSHPVCEDKDTRIEIEHISKSSRRKRGSRSSSRCSSRLPSGNTSPTDNMQTVKTDNSRGTKDRAENQRSGCENSESIPYDCRTDTSSQNGKLSKSGCDNSEENMSKSKKSVEENIKFKEKLLKEVDKETQLYENLKEGKNNLNKINPVEKVSEENVTKEGNDAVVRRVNLPSAKNLDKRVSFTESTGFTVQKSMHNRLSLCGDPARGAEIRDLSDLRDLLSNLKDQGLLPSTLALEELFSSFDQTSPVLSERAPPEGQEDPPLHQSIMSLAPNNNNMNDDNKNNNDSKDATSKGIVADSTQEVDEKRRLDIIGGVRWEELTKIGREMIGDGGIGEEEQDLEAPSTGARPKQRLGCEFSKSDSMLNRIGNDPNMVRNRLREKREKRKSISLAEKRRLYKESLRRERKLPSLYIPVEVDASKFVEENNRLNLEIVQGQSNIVTSGHTVDIPGQEEIKKQLFTSPEERFYKLFSVREGHSSGSSVSVQVVLSSQTLYVVTPLPKWSKPRHIVPYHDIHTIIVGSNDQWVCILNKTSVLDDLATTGTNSGVQLEIGDPDVAHSLVSCLEVAIRRHFSALKLSRDEQKTVTATAECKFLPQGRRRSQLLSKECADNFSNSLLERSQLTSQGSKQVSLDISMESPDISQQDSLAMTPASLSCSQDSPVASEVSLVSETSCETSSESSQKSSDISHVDTENTHSSVDTSQDLSDLSQASSVSQDDDDDTRSSDTVSSPVELLENPSHEISQDDNDDGQAQEKLQDHGPVLLHLEKQYGMQRYAGGYSRWNGMMLERSLPAVVVHPAWELSGLRKWLRAQLRLQSEPEVVGYWLVDWEDGSSLGVGEAAGPLGPAIEGSLMFRPPGILASWKPAYFILKAGVLYQFNDARERLPYMIEEVGQCIGCVRIATNHRPHAFQLLRKNAAPIMLAASDEHEASLWLQAFLTVINSGVRDISERSQISCRVILLDSGVLLTQQSDMILGVPPCVSNTATEENQMEKQTATNQQTQQLLSVSPIMLSPGQWDKKDLQRPVNPMLSNLRDRKPLSSSLTNLHRTSSTSSIPSSPIRRISTGEKTSAQNRKGSLTRLSDTGNPDINPIGKEKGASYNISNDSKPKNGAVVNERSQILERFKGKGEIKVLTYSALEQVCSISVYAECPSTCLLEFECSEAGEISGDWALYFRSGGQLQNFVTTLARTWKNFCQDEFPLHTIDDPGVQQFLLEGSQISSSGWSSHV